MNTQQIIIVGGMGPQAGLSLHRRIINKAAQFGARDGDEFPEIIHISLPIKDFISDPTAMSAALELITRRLERLYLWQRYERSYCL